MERKALDILNEWLTDEFRKPLIIRGARQVGKTWLMKEFGSRSYLSTAYVNFEKSAHLKDLFKSDFDVSRIIAALQIETGIKIEAGQTLIILDEIQEAERAITSLKYFQEEAPQYHVIAAGSLLGVALHRKTSFPVGKVAFLDLFPMSFIEFLKGIGQGPLAGLLEDGDWDLIKTFRSKLITQLRTYYYTGGMPEVVSSFRESGDFKKVRSLQNAILSAYENDFSKYAPVAIVPRIRMLWHSIPAQLAKENKKFIYRVLKEGARAKEYELALSWLVDCGLVHKVHRVSKPGIPLKGYEDPGAFKLFISDVGLLGAMGDIDLKTLLEGNAIFEEFKGALAEQYVLQQLKAIPDLPVFYWSAERTAAEIDFLVQHAGKVIPIEVKAEENLKAKSLRVFHEKFKPSLSLRTSLSNFRMEKWLVNLPLYAIHKVTEL